MPKGTIDKLIINSPYEEPAQFWKYERETRLFDLVQGRRPAGYVVASGDSKAFDDPGIFVEIPLVNQIRPRIMAWREAGYPGVTSITKRLLEHWRDPEEFETRRFFFCQLEAIETLIWLLEAPASERVGIDVPGDGGAFMRQCCKMATGSGKTIVMAMVIAWHILNKVAYPMDARFAKNVLIMAPGLTVKNRLGVLEPAAEGNYYEAFSIVPPALFDKLRQGKVMVRNWHALSWDSEEQIKKRRADNAAAEAKDITELKAAENAVETATLEMKRNEVISKIDAEKNAQNLEEASANLAQFRETLELKRVARLADVRILELQRDRARKSMEYASVNMEKLSIRAAIDGMVVLTPTWMQGQMREVQEGDQVFPGNPIMQIVNPAGMQVRARVNQADVTSLRLGQSVQVRLDAYPELVFAGKLDSLAAVGATSSMNQKVRTFTAVFSIAGSDPRLLPDLSAAVDIPLAAVPGRTEQAQNMKKQN